MKSRSLVLAFTCLLAAAPLPFATGTPADAPSASSTAEPPADGATPATAPATRPANRVRGADLGVNIHFTRPRPGELRMMADAGVSVVRMDFTWAATERRPGAYDFAAYDGLLAALDAHAIRPIFILDYGNKLYDDGLSPHTDAGRAAFAKWAAAVAAHFKGRGVTWEMWNEPDGDFWKPKANADDYAKLAVATGEAVRAADPAAAFVGPATSGIDLPFLEACFKAGCLEHWSAVTVHPYRRSAPETAAGEYRALRRLIARYGPKGKSIPIYSGEWGYSAAWKDHDEDRQGRYLPRQWLTNVANDVPVSVWYDWRDDGRDPKESEHHFGTVRNEGRKPGGASGDGGGAQPWEPKPAYRAMRALADELGGFEFSKRLAVGDYETDYVLLFARKDEQGEPADVRLAVWTTAAEPRELLIPASDGRFRRNGHVGEPLGPLSAGLEGLRVVARPDVQYLAPAAANDVLLFAAGWSRLPLDYGASLRGGWYACFGTTVYNPTRRTVRASARITGGAGASAVDVRPGETLGLGTPAWITLWPATQVHAVYLRAGAGPDVGQWVAAGPYEPSEFAVVGAGAGEVAVLVRIADPQRDGESAAVAVEAADGRSGSATVKLAFGKPVLARVPLDGPAAPATTVSPAVAAGGRPPTAPTTVRVAVRVSDDVGERHAGAPLAALPLAGYTSLPLSADGGGLPLKAVADGDRRVKSEQSVRPAAAPEQPLVGDVPTFELSYRFDAGHKFVQVMPARDELRPLPGKPRELRLWVYGDGSGNLLRARVVGADGQTFQPTAGRLDWTGWRPIAFPLDGRDAGHWGGPDDGVVRYPLTLDTLLLVDSAERRATGGTVYVAAPMVVE